MSSRHQQHRGGDDDDDDPVSALMAPPTTTAPKAAAAPKSALSADSPRLPSKKVTLLLPRPPTTAAGEPWSPPVNTDATMEPWLTAHPFPSSIQKLEGVNVVGKFAGDTENTEYTVVGAAYALADEDVADLDAFLAAGRVAYDVVFHLQPSSTAALPKSDESIAKKLAENRWCYATQRGHFVELPASHRARLDGRTSASSRSGRPYFKNLRKYFLPRFASSAPAPAEIVAAASASLPPLPPPLSLPPLPLPQPRPPLPPPTEEAHVDQPLLLVVDAARKPLASTTAAAVVAPAPTPVATAVVSAPAVVAPPKRAAAVTSPPPRLSTKDDEENASDKAVGAAAAAGARVAVVHDGNAATLAATKLCKTRNRALIRKAEERVYFTKYDDEIITRWDGPPKKTNSSGWHTSLSVFNLCGVHSTKNASVRGTLRRFNKAITEAFVVAVLRTAVGALWSLSPPNPKPKPKSKKKSAAKPSPPSATTSGPATVSKTNKRALEANGTDADGDEPSVHGAGNGGAPLKTTKRGKTAAAAAALSQPAIKKYFPVIESNGGDGGDDGGGGRSIESRLVPTTPRDAEMTIADFLRDRSAKYAKYIGYMIDDTVLLPAVDTLQRSIITSEAYRQSTLFSESAMQRLALADDLAAYYCCVVLWGLDSKFTVDVGGPGIPDVCMTSPEDRCARATLAAFIFYAKHLPRLAEMGAQNLAGFSYHVELSQLMMTVEKHYAYVNRSRAKIQ